MRRREGSIFLLSLVEGAVMLDPGDSEAGHAGTVDRALPAGKLLEREAVALARLVHAEQAAIDRGHHLGLAANDPARGSRRRQRLDRERLPERADHMGGANLLVLDHSYLKNT